MECLDLNRDSARFDLDYETDFADITHLNYAGAQKATRYLMEELCARYDFADHRGDDAYALWEENRQYDAYQVQRQALTECEAPTPETVLEAAGTLPGFTAIVTVPAGDTDALTPALRTALTEAGVPAQDLDAGGQWILSAGECRGAVTAGGEALSLDLNAVHNLALNRDGAQSVELNGTACDVSPGHLSVVLYDNYEAEVLLCCES